MYGGKMMGIFERRMKRIKLSRKRKQTDGGIG